MPKDPKKNVDRFKVRGGDINEFEFHKNQEQVVKPPKPSKAKASKAANSRKTKAAKK